LNASSYDKSCLSLTKENPTIIPLTSIIIPVYNGAAFLRRSVTSALAQDYGNTEIIIVDNASTDETPTLMRELAGEHPQLILTRCKKRGASAARNHGLKRATGEWIQFLDVDDALFPDKVKRQLAEATTRTEWIIGGYRNQYSDGSTLDNIPHSDPWKGLVFKYRIGCTHANLYRKAALEKIGGWKEDLVDNEDPELHFQLLANNANYLIIPEVSCVYHHRSAGQLSGRAPVGGNLRRLALLQRVNAFLREERSEYWVENEGYFRGALLRAIRVLATHNLGAAAGAYGVFLEQRGSTPPELISPLLLKLYSLLGFRRTESLRLKVRRILPDQLKAFLKSPR
jgi:glycosyltransferase involved in cell wall biosynthesis